MVILQNFDSLQIAIISYIIVQVIIGYICFVIRNYIAVRDDEDWKAGFVFLLFCLIPAIPEIILTIGLLKSYRRYKNKEENKQNNNEEKPKIIVKEIDINDEDDIAEQLKDIINEIKNNKEK